MPSGHRRFAIAMMAVAAWWGAAVTAAESARGEAMNDDVTVLMRDWLQMVAMGPAEAWNDKVAEDVLIRLPYAPPGVEKELRGFATARDTLAHHWKTKQSFLWRDVVIRKTQDPELLVTTARSEVVLASGQPYENDYVMLTRFRDGKVIEHVEYFNPLPIIDMLRK